MGAVQLEVAMVVADVDLGDLIWTTIWIFFLILFIWVFIMIVSDLFRDHKLSGWAKALWVLGLIIFPLIGSLVYLIARGEGMAERSASDQRQARAEFDSYVRATAASTGTAPVDDLTRLAELRNNGTISDAEFEAMKARVVGGGDTGTTTGTGTPTGTGTTATP
ncbi:MAG TPA: SHOCT domain-containing protein [Acidimicrobiales bacterium]|nr:SHOCT domain-containing protein [Acidimicrobiales bacterium]